MRHDHWWRFGHRELVDQPRGRINADRCGGPQVRGVDERDCLLVARRVVEATELAGPELGIRRLERRRDLLGGEKREQRRVDVGTHLRDRHVRPPVGQQVEDPAQLPTGRTRRQPMLRATVAELVGANGRTVGVVLRRSCGARGFGRR